MRDVARDQAGLVRPVHPDEASARPLGEHVRTGARPERDRAVERVVEVRELVANVELARRGRPVRLADPDARREDHLAVALQDGGLRLPVDVQVRLHRASPFRASSAGPSRSSCSAGSGAARGTRSRTGVIARAARIRTMFWVPSPVTVRSVVTSFECALGSSRAPTVPDHRGPVADPSSSSAPS